MTTEYITEQFLREIGRHEMQIIRDDGVNRHLRFKRPGTMCMHFDLITWPGYLCYTGDMGTYVFRRLEDMLEFFRERSGLPQYTIDYRYWAEKLQAMDHDGVKKYSADKFRAAIEDRFADYAEDMPDTARHDLYQRVRDEVLAYASDGPHEAVRAALEFDQESGIHRKQVFQDFWEVDVTEYTHRFLWCCHALRWAIAKYDATRLTSGEQGATITT